MGQHFLTEFDTSGSRENNFKSDNSGLRLMKSQQRSKFLQFFWKSDVIFKEFHGPFHCCWVSWQKLENTFGVKFRVSGGPHMCQNDRVSPVQGERINCLVSCNFYAQ